MRQLNAASHAVIANTSARHVKCGKPRRAPLCRHPPLHVVRHPLRLRPSNHGQYDPTTAKGDAGDSGCSAVHKPGAGERSGTYNLTVIGLKARAMHLRLAFCSDEWAPCTGCETLACIGRAIPVNHPDAPWCRCWCGSDLPVARQRWWLMLNRCACNTMGQPIRWIRCWANKVPKLMCFKVGFVRCCALCSIRAAPAHHCTFTDTSSAVTANSNIAFVALQPWDCH